MTYLRTDLMGGGHISVTMAPRLYPRFHHGSWWAYDHEYDSDTGPYSTRKQAQQWINEIRVTAEKGQTQETT